MHDMHNGKCVVEVVQGVGGCVVALSMVVGQDGRRRCGVRQEASQAAHTRLSSAASSLSAVRFTCRRFAGVAAEAPPLPPAPLS